MKFVEFPKWLYHSSDGAVIVQTHDEQEALGRGWQDHPIPELEPQEKVPTHKAPVKKKAK